MKRRVFFRHRLSSLRKFVLTDVTLLTIYSVLATLALWLLPFAADAQHAVLSQNQGQGIEIKPQIRDYKVTLGATRVIYDPDGRGAELWVENGQDYPMLVQSRTVDESQKKSAPFVVTPPLFRLDGNQRSRLRIVRTGGEFPTDRETLQWLCVKAIPPSGGDNWLKTDGKAGKSGAPAVGFLVSLNNCIKLLTRPASLHGTPLDVAGNVKWQREGSQLRGRNDSPFYINLISLKVNGVEVSQPHYIPPYGTQTYTVPRGGAGGSRVQWQIITDNGGKGPLYDATAG
ncbi:fimbria/pilus periplasmic chaperone [Klebsiella variicola]|uniref:fimbria/pilus periplasmic chaperone n=1 Tax=Klebsiella variicola TaxID=244366 RepID=UPI003D9807F9